MVSISADNQPLPPFPQVLKEGYNILPDGEKIFYVSNPALGLWAYRGRFERSDKAGDNEEDCKLDDPKKRKREVESMTGQEGKN